MTNREYCPACGDLCCLHTEEQAAGYRYNQKIRIRNTAYILDVGKQFLYTNPLWQPTTVKDLENHPWLKDGKVCRRDIRLLAKAIQNIWEGF